MFVFRGCDSSSKQILTWRRKELDPIQAQLSFEPGASLPTNLPFGIAGSFRADGALTDQSFFNHCAQDPFGSTIKSMNPFSEYFFL